MTTINFSLADKRFGLEKRAEKLPYTINNRVSEIHQLMQELRFKEAMEEVMEHFTGQYSLVRAGNLEVG